MRIKPRLPRLTKGTTYGRWTIIGVPIKENSKWSVECRCACGVVKIVSSCVLLNRHASPNISCGCYRRERITAVSTTHGLSKSPAFNVWNAIMQRCYNQNHKYYKDYGGRGITVSKSWHKFETFYQDMWPRPYAKATIDRKYNSKGYSKANCRWTTQQEQCNNRRSNRRLTIKGKTLTAAQWARESGVGITLYLRLKRGWSPVDAVTTPLRVWPTTETG